MKQTCVCFFSKTSMYVYIYCCFWKNALTPGAWQPQLEVKEEKNVNILGYSKEVNPQSNAQSLRAKNACRCFALFGENQLCGAFAKIVLKCRLKKVVAFRSVHPSFLTPCYTHGYKTYSISRKRFNNAYFSRLLPTD